MKEKDLLIYVEVMKKYIWGEAMIAEKKRKRDNKYYTFIII